jgi:pimeloyl-ACP methyl ester carboxylesterase
MQIWVDGPRRTPHQLDPAVRRLALAMNAIALANEGVGTERPLEPPATGRLGEVRAPALIIVGELDTARTQAAADLLDAGLPNARRVVLTGAAHLPNMEKPESYNRLVREFLS